ncbi:Hcp family type VI secretion system effector [Aliivibrio fischeri]|uniref:Hcp family type VI secretion system effector n=1 Tax=Aliivibrio fischeri TaxID=668 RepID=UPI0007C4B29E|nr:Hcp family type VI secretion system effector [Aliivibrio fischeri]MBP3140193.1 Hcp family type VI secretion system effector [Aliivibrio fischeri]MBP3154575.1 Hcp family type VI secretion system effector [Aliivibrio fischeri]MCE7575735.1 Hcp family type VI secretion system effector [Aliivibrio fischeri]
MAGIAYLTINSTNKGCISQGCNTQNSMGNTYQRDHEDEITVLSFSHGIEYQNKSIHSPVQIIKKIDKSTPLLAQACSDGDVLDCTISFYRPSSKSGLEKFYEIVLTGALIRSVSTHMPHVINFEQDEMQEVVLISYRDIQWKHLAGNTNGYGSWLKSISDQMS